VRVRWSRHFSARRAIELVRAQPDMVRLHKGAHLSFATAEPGFSCLARSFAAIYVLALVFDGPHDELRAKRAMARSLPNIERLVLALPPRDPPTSMGGAAALRRRS
jgi:hypothetical protein